MNKTNNKDMMQKTDFNHWSISYLKEIYQCSKCKKRNTIVASFNLQGEKQRYQNCVYCGNPNYIK